MLYKLSKQKNIRLDDNMTLRLERVCNHLRMRESDAIRDAIKEWIVDQEWKLKVKGWFVEPGNK